MTKLESGKRYRKLVNEIARQPPWRTTAEQERQQLDGRNELAKVLGNQSQMEDEIRILRDPWVYIRRRYAECSEFRARIDRIK